MAAVPPHSEGVTISGWSADAERGLELLLAEASPMRALRVDTRPLPPAHDEDSTLSEEISIAPDLGLCESPQQYFAVWRRPVSPDRREMVKSPVDPKLENDWRLITQIVPELFEGRAAIVNDNRGEVRLEGARRPIKVDSGSVSIEGKLRGNMMSNFAETYDSLYDLGESVSRYWDSMGTTSSPPVITITMLPEHQLGRELFDRLHAVVARMWKTGESGALVDLLPFSMQFHAMGLDAFYAKIIGDALIVRQKMVNAGPPEVFDDDETVEAMAMRWICSVQGAFVHRIVIRHTNNDLLHENEFLEDLVKHPRPRDGWSFVEFTDQGEALIDTLTDFPDNLKSVLFKRCPCPIVSFPFPSRVVHTSRGSRGRSSYMASPSKRMSPGTD